MLPKWKEAEFSVGQEVNRAPGKCGKNDPDRLCFQDLISNLVFFHCKRGGSMNETSGVQSGNEGVGENMQAGEIKTFLPDQRHLALFKQVNVAERLRETEESVFRR